MLVSDMPVISYLGAGLTSISAKGWPDVSIVQRTNIPALSEPSGKTLPIVPVRTCWVSRRALTAVGSMSTTGGKLTSLLTGLAVRSLQRRLLGLREGGGSAGQSKQRNQHDTGCGQD